MWPTDEQKISLTDQTDRVKLTLTTQAKSAVVCCDCAEEGVENGMGVEKMKRFVMGLGCVAGLVLAPSIASAALSLQIGPKMGAAPTVANSDAEPLPGRQFFDLIFNETGPADNEGLFAYDLLLTVPQSQ